MVKRLWIVLILSSTIFAIESGDWAHRAMLSYKKGNYSKSQRQFQRAFEAAQKEGDLENKVRITANLARLYIDQLLLKEADSLLTRIPQLEGDPEVYTALKARKDFMAQDCQESYDLPALEGASRSSLMFWVQMCGLTQGSNQISIKNLGDGMISTLEGMKFARDKQWQESITKWDRAILNARKAGLYGAIVDLLWFKAWAYDQLGEGQKSLDQLAQSYEAAARAGLPIPMVRAAKKWLKVNTNEDLEAKVNKITEALKGSILPQTLEFPQFR